MSNWRNYNGRMELMYWASPGDLCQTVAAVVENKFGHWAWYLPVCGDNYIRGIEHSENEAKIAAEQGLREWRDWIVRLVNGLLGEAL